MARAAADWSITYKDVEEDFAGIEGIEVGHFNAIEGVDRWGTSTR